jgi:hypothetical protein
MFPPSRVKSKKMSESDPPLPPATFDFLIMSLHMQAQVHLGLVSLPGAEKSQPNLKHAQHTIETLAMLSEKTKGNLEVSEKRALENALTELRFRYVQVSAQLTGKAGA